MKFITAFNTENTEKNEGIERDADEKFPFG